MKLQWLIKVLFLVPIHAISTNVDHSSSAQKIVKDGDGEELQSGVSETQAEAHLATPPSLSRKRDTNIDLTHNGHIHDIPETDKHNIREEESLSEEEELFLRYLQQEVSVSFSYAPTASPTKACSDSTNFFTATKPGANGWVKQKDCAGWVKRRSTAWRCYNVGGVAEGCPKTCTNCCVETEGTFVLYFNQKVKECAWAKLNPDVRCKKPPTRQMCPNACGLCD